MSNKNINSFFAEGKECEIFCIWCQEGFKRKGSFTKLYNIHRNKNEELLNITSKHLWRQSSLAILLAE